jgi:RNA polymerase sigma-70 factor (ECF subfamily)
VTGIALNVCRNKLASAAERQRRRSISLVSDDPETGEPRVVDPADPQPGPDSVALAGELREALARALAALAPEQREILLLREMEGLEYEDLARTLGCAVGTVKSRLCRARAALRAALEGIWP